jgi:hypothetical protein
VPEFQGLKLSQDVKVAHRPQWGVRRVEVARSHDRLLVDFFGTIGWGGNSGFGALNLAVQFGAKRIVLVGFDMRLDKGLHWHGAHAGLHNPNDRNVARWRRVIDGAAPTLKALGVEVLNASPISALQAYPKVDFMEAINEEPIWQSQHRLARPVAAA